MAYTHRSRVPYEILREGERRATNDALPRQYSVQEKRMVLTGIGGSATIDCPISVRGLDGRISLRVVGVSIPMSRSLIRSGYNVLNISGLNGTTVITLNEMTPSAARLAAILQELCNPANPATTLYGARTGAVLDGSLTVTYDADLKRLTFSLTAASQNWILQPQGKLGLRMGITSDGLTSSTLTVATTGATVASQQFPVLIDTRSLWIKFDGLTVEDGYVRSTSRVTDCLLHVPVSVDSGNILELAGETLDPHLSKIVYFSTSNLKQITATVYDDDGEVYDTRTVPVILEIVVSCTEMLAY
jgi:hypothetical protein